MNMSRVIHDILVSTAIGVSLICGGALLTSQVGAQAGSNIPDERTYSGGSGSQALKEQKYEARMKSMPGEAPAVVAAAGEAAAAESAPVVADQRTDNQADVKSENLAGGFYKDGHKGDDWFYDFYESPIRRSNSQGNVAGVPPAPGSIDSECRVALEKLCGTIEPGSGRLRTCYEDNKGKLTPSCRQQVEERPSEAAAILGMTPRKDSEPTMQQASDRTNTRNVAPVRRADQDRLADAAYHSTSTGLYAQRRQSQGRAFSSYYDDPWFYEERNPAYVVPITMAQTEPYRPAARDQETVSGLVEQHKQVRNITRGGQNTVALVRTSDNRLVITDLGPNQPLLALALTEGDPIKVIGHRENIGSYSVLMGHQVNNRVIPNRAVAWSGRDYREVKGRIEQFRDLRVRQTNTVHQAMAVRTDDGGLVLVDFGPSTAGNILANAAQGDRITTSGSIAQVGNYPVLFAERVSLDDDTPVLIARPENEYSEPPRRSFEASQQEPSR
jgi:hypothetical protein